MIIDPNTIQQDLKKTYNAAGEQFDQTRSYLWEDIKRLKQYIQKGDMVVDLGCGAGRLVELCTDMDASYIGIDQSEVLIRIAKEKYPEQRFFVADMTQTPLEVGMADVVFAIASFHHLPTHELRIAGLKEMKRLLKPEGTIVMLNWNLFSDWARKKYNGDEDGNFFIPWKNSKKEVLGSRYYKGFLLEELHELAQSVGLRIDEQYYVKKGEVSSIGPGENIITVLTVQ